MFDWLNIDGIIDWFNTHYTSIRNSLEIVYFISASLVPIILGIITFKYSKEVNKREKYEHNLLKISNQLNAKIMLQTSEGSNGERLHEYIHILNARNVSLKSAEIEYQSFVELGDNNNCKKLLIPLYGYYGTQSGNLEQDGIVSLYPYKENRKFFANLFGEFSQINVEKNSRMYINFEIMTYIKIEYTNILDEPYTEYYLMDVSGNPTRLKEKQSADLEKKLDVEKEDFYSLTAKELWNRFIKLNNLDTKYLA